MRIETVRIQNFRCLQDVTVDFDDVTTLIGPNGSGKSTVLRALDWFFSPNPTPLDPEVDVFRGATEDNQTVMVQVTFNDLTNVDRNKLGKYAPDGAETATITLTWGGSGAPKLTGRAKAFPPFERIRTSKGNAGEKKDLWKQVVSEIPVPLREGLSPGLAANAMGPAMDGWEHEHPEMLEDVDAASESHMFGFNGKNVMSGLFDYVFVAADLRASEETVDDGKRSVVSRLLERAVDKHAADEEVKRIAQRATQDQQDAARQHLGGQLQVLQDEFTQELSTFIPGRSIQLDTRFPEPRRQDLAINVSVLGHNASSPLPVERQGHGLQRALLVTALKLLASKTSQARDRSVIVMAIEEPELYQHPGQARALAHALRRLAGDRTMQVIYATHSPYFVEGTNYHEIRRITRSPSTPGVEPTVDVHAAPLARVVQAVQGFMDESAVLNTWSRLWTQGLSEALFADAVVLVEGDTDCAVLNGASARSANRHLAADGIIVAPAYGKTCIYAAHAVLSLLGIPTLTVFDSDSGQPDRTRDRASKKESAEKDADDQDKKNQRENRALLRYFGATEESYPSGRVSDTVFVWDDDLERELERSWPEWQRARETLISANHAGGGGKLAATYKLAAQTATREPKGQVAEVLEMARALASASAAR
jgi:predicted ATP-dependent endonuclease of OLD family